MDPNEPTSAAPGVPLVETAPAAAANFTVAVDAWCVDTVGRLCQITAIDDEGVATVAVDNVLGFSMRDVASLRVALAKELPPHVTDRVGYQ